MEYKTIKGEAEAEIVEKKSRFIAHLCHVDTEEEALEFLSRIRSENQQARHNVYAYILSGGRTRYSDDGEPAQTSGMPTFEVLSHAGIENVICVTTRYFGGVLLGTGGLVRAYTQAAQNALAVAHIVTVTECCDITVDVDYSNYQIVERFIRDNKIVVLSTNYGASVRVVMRVLAPDANEMAAKLTDLTAGQAAISISEPKMSEV